MIRIERGAEIDGSAGDRHRHGFWEYSCPTYPLVRGYSRQPLLDACRQLKSLYGVTGQLAGVFRKGSEVADISCPIETGAATTVKEPDRSIIRFGKYVDLNEVFGKTDATPDNPSLMPGLVEPSS